ncbi:EFR1 family ferrodoxin [Butyrivibrio sp. AE3006]|uniref:EFR1 family ferrodoxin n=1 Tax=Butyrivibrio sp. AE3006 TaxID=1280673 RepID=UPI000426A5A9|nr:EFR1 family ferrodoxin [Butyrivibrio sp. AE3006]
MTVLYFSSTGNCLYIAKRIGGRLLSIPECIREENYHIEDSEVGLVFPVYGLCVPPFIVEFLEKTSIRTSYLFAVATYGFFPGAVCGQLSKIRTKDGRCFDYINRLKMAENCITFSDMAKQKGDSKKQQSQIDELLADITEHKRYIREDSPFKKLMTKNHLKNYEFETGVGITDMLSVSADCTGCGTCACLCPMQNISIIGGAPIFDSNCISCGACLQNCPRNAIHHQKEKSSARYRNPHIGLEELKMSS